MQDGTDPGAVDDARLEALLERLLEVAAKKDALRSWSQGVPLQSALEAAPPVEARRDDDGTLGVFRFFEIVKTDADRMRSLTPVLAKERIEPLQGERVKIGDEVGVELPLGRLAAIAWADLDAVRAGKTQLLPEALGAALQDEALADAVSARLSSMRGPPPHVPLRRVVTDHGGDAVLWTSVTSAEPAELIVLVQRADEHRLIVVPARTSAAGHAALLRALAPAPPERSLWRFFEVEGAALLCGSEGAIWSDDVLGRRLSLEIKAIAIARDPSVYGVARARARLLTWAGDKIVDEVEDLVGLSLDLPRTLECSWPEGAALERVRQAARAFRTQVQRRLSALVDERQPHAGDALAGTGVMRVLARHAAGVELLALADAAAEPCPAREGPESDAELWVRFADALFGLSPADDCVRSHGADGDVELYVDGALPDGDAEQWQALTQVLSRSLAQSEADVELAFDESDDADTTLLSAWLLSLGEAPPQGFRWPVRRNASEAAAITALWVDRFVDPGPVGADDASASEGRSEEDAA